MTAKKKGFSIDEYFEVETPLVRSESLEDSEFYHERMKEIEEEKETKTKNKVGRPRNDELVRGKASQYGLTKDYTRMSYIISLENVAFIQNYAYTERIRVQDALEHLIELGRKQVEKQYTKEGKTLLQKEKRK